MYQFVCSSAEITELCSNQHLISGKLRSNLYFSLSSFVIGMSIISSYVTVYLWSIFLSKLQKLFDLIKKKEPVVINRLFVYLLFHIITVFNIKLSSIFPIIPQLKKTALRKTKPQVYKIQINLQITVLDTLIVFLSYQSTFSSEVNRLHFLLLVLTSLKACKKSTTQEQILLQDLRHSLSSDA